MPFRHPISLLFGSENCKMTVRDVFQVRKSDKETGNKHKLSPGNRRQVKNWVTFPASPGQTHTLGKGVGGGDLCFQSSGIVGRCGTQPTSQSRSVRQNAGPRGAAGKNQPHLTEKKKNCQCSWDFHSFHSPTRWQAAEQNEKTDLVMGPWHPSHPSKKTETLTPKHHLRP